MAIPEIIASTAPAWAGPVAGAAVGGGMGLIGDIFSGRAAKKAAKRAQAFSERMANTQHQREVADLKAAGLNPILSGTGGAGAAAPSGVTAQVPDYGENTGKVAANAIAFKQAQASTDLLNEQAKLAEAQRVGQNLTNIERGGEAMDGKGGQIGFQAFRFEAERRTAIATIQDLVNKATASGIDAKSKARDFERLDDKLTWMAANAPGNFDREELKSLLEKGEGLDWATYARKILPGILQILLKSSSGRR